MSIEAPNTEVESILQPESNQDNRFQLIDETSPNKNFELLETSSDKTTDPNNYELVKPEEPTRVETILERADPTYYTSLFSRVDLNKIADEYNSTGLTDRKANIKFNQLLRFSGAAAKLSHSNPIDLMSGNIDNDMKLVARTNINELEKSGEIKSNRNFELIERTVPTPEEKSRKLMEAAEQVRQTQQAYNDYERVRKNISGSRSKLRKTGEELWNSVLYNYRRNQQDYDYANFTEAVLPKIQNEMSYFGVIPNLRRKIPIEAHREAQTINVDDIHPVILTQSAESSAARLLHGPDIENILKDTIPGYFLRRIEQVNLFEPDMSKLKDEKSRTHATINHTRGPYSEIERVIMNLNILNSFPENLPDEFRAAFEASIYRSAVELIAHEGAHAIIELLTIEEQKQWISIYESEVKKNPEARRTINSYKKRDSTTGLAGEMFAQIYEVFMVDSEGITNDFPKSSEFITQIIDTYASPEQRSRIYEAIKLHQPVNESAKKMYKELDLVYTPLKFATKTHRTPERYHEKAKGITSIKSN